MKWEFSIQEILHVKNKSRHQINNFAEYLRVVLELKREYH